jgi:hypothetical protein
MLASIQGLQLKRIMHSNIRRASYKSCIFIRLVSIVLTSLVLLLFTAIELSLGGGSPYTSNK